MQINRASLFGFIIVFSLFFPRLVMAASPDAAVRVQTGYIKYAYERKAFTVFDERNLFFSSTSKYRLEDTLPFLGAGATLFFDDFYLDLYAQKSFSGSDTTTTLDNFINPEPDGSGSFSHDVTSTTFGSNWDRIEYSFTAGYSVTERFRLFAGFRGSETSISQTVTLTDITVSGPLIVGTVNENSDYSEKGIFLGGSYAWSINGNRSWSWFRGALLVNTGLAFVDGKTKTSFSVGFADFNSEVKGDTVGLLFGIAWNGYLGKVFTKDFYYTAGVNGYRYDFEVDNAEDDPFDGGFSNFSETVLQFTLGLSMPLAF